MGAPGSGRADQGGLELSPSVAAPARHNNAQAASRHHLHGRRRGRRLRERLQRLLRERLPGLRLDRQRPAPDPLTRLFAAPVDDVWLEIGFGGGEHLALQARAHPRVGLIGCEPFVNGVAKLLAQLEPLGFDAIRIHDGDAGDVLPWLPAGGLGRVFLLFPDPWPKKRHRKRRFVGAGALDALARVMRSGAELRFATDCGDYAAEVLLAIRRHAAFVWPAEGPGDWRERCDPRNGGDWPGTRYEQKARQAGRRCYFLRFRRV